MSQSISIRSVIASGGLDLRYSFAAAGREPSAAALLLKLNISGQ
jgi:hypothetical protein